MIYIKKYKNFILIPLVCFICFVYIPPKKAQAFVFIPALYLLAPEVIPAVAEILISSGITFTALGGVDGIKKICNDYSSTASGLQYLTDLSTQIKDTAFNGVVNITDAFWTDIKGWSSTIFNVGNNYNITTNQTWPGYPVSPVKSVTYPYQAIVNWVGIGPRLIVSDRKFWKSGNNLMISSGGSGMMYNILDGVWELKFGGTSFSIDGGILFQNCDIYTDASLSVVFTANNADVAVAIGADNIKDPTRDWTNTDTAKRSIPIAKFADGTVADGEAVTTALNEWLGKTAADVAGQSVDIPQDDVLDPPSSVDIFPWLAELFGWFNGLFTAIKAIPREIVEAIIPLIDSIKELIKPKVDDMPSDLPSVLPNKIPFNKFQHSLDLINDINTGQGTPPRIEFDLGALFQASVGRFGVVSPFHGNSVLFDFADLNAYSFGGFTLINYFRGIIVIGFYLTTIFYCYKKLQEQTI
ncbi:MAG TPA: hypothetical protein VIK86_10350 [Candidatus Paceibacterota bacterium]